MFNCSPFVVPLRVDLHGVPHGVGHRGANPRRSTSQRRPSKLCCVYAGGGLLIVLSWVKRRRPQS